MGKYWDVYPPAFVTTLTPVFDPRSTAALSYADHLLTPWDHRCRKLGSWGISSSILNQSWQPEWKHVVFLMVSNRKRNLDSFSLLFLAGQYNWIQYIKKKMVFTFYSLCTLIFLWGSKAEVWFVYLDVLVIKRLNSLLPELVSLWTKYSEVQFYLFCARKRLFFHPFTPETWKAFSGYRQIWSWWSFHRSKAEEQKQTSVFPYIFCFLCCSFLALEQKHLSYPVFQLLCSSSSSVCHRADLLTPAFCPSPLPEGVQADLCWPLRSTRFLLGQGSLRAVVPARLRIYFFFP